MYKSISTLLILTVALSFTSYSQYIRFDISTFESIKLHSKGFYNGDDSKGGFANGHFYYRQNYDTAWKSWSGIAVSNHKDTVTNSYTNEFSNIIGGGYNASENFAVCYNSGTIVSEKSSKLHGLYVTNTTYAYHTIKNGSAFSKKFGGASGNDKDWFRVKFVSYNNGNRADSLYFYLADYRFDDNKQDYVLKKWEYVSFSGFMQYTDSLKISFESTDNGTFGMNTPAYMAFDDFNFSEYRRNFFYVEPDFLNDSNKVWNGETDTSGGFDVDGFYFVNNYDTKWKTWNGWAISKDNDTSKTGLDAQYSSITSSEISLISYGRSIINFPLKEKFYFRYLIFSNNTYTYKAMKYGDAFSKKFGGVKGDDKDFLKLNVIFYRLDNPIDTLIYFLADFRNKPGVIDNKIVVYFLNLSNYTRVEFQLESTDNGTWGMNTPAYFCLSSIYGVWNIKKETIKKTKVFPNPANDFLLTDITNFERYQIADVSGKDYTSVTTADANKIDINKLPHGVFVIKILRDHVVYYSRFVK